MNCLSSPSIVLPSRPLPGRVFTGIGAALRTTLRALRFRWRAYRARRRQARSFRAISEMDVRILRDIGAPDELISRAAARIGGRHGREIPFQLWVVLVAIAVIGTATPASAADAARPQTTSKAYAQGTAVGGFTGEFVNGAPLYRFPPVIVTGSHKAKPAERKHATPPWQTRATTAKGPA